MSEASIGSRAWVAEQFDVVEAELRQGRPAEELWGRARISLALWLDVSHPAATSAGRGAFELLTELQCRLRGVGASVVMDQVREMLGAGGKEYANEDDAFSQFKASASRVGITPGQALRVFAGKHVDGIQSHFDGHVSQREPVTDRVKDLLTYLVLDRLMHEAAELLSGGAE